MWNKGIRTGIRMDLRKLNTDFLKKLKDKLKSDKKLLTVVIIGLIGILLLFVSELTNKSSDKTTINVDTQAVVSINDYETRLEQKLKTLVESIDGAGETTVMITLESTSENIYAKDDDYSTNKQSEDSKITEKIDETQEYIIIKSKSGDESGLVIRVVQPEVRGVAIVCEGGDQYYVKQQIMDSLKAVLNIAASDISISKSK